jgi:hypothetical protein
MFVHTDIRHTLIMITHTTEDTLSREVPTHLFQFKEKIFGFFTIPQLLYDTVAFVGLWYLYNRPMSVLLRVSISVVYALVVLFIVHIPIRGRSVVDWAFLYTRFFITPRQTVWRPAAQTRLSSGNAKAASVATVQSTWVPLQSIARGVMGFAPGRTSKDKLSEPDTYCMVFEVGGINLDVLSQEEQARIFTGFETFLAGLQFGLETYTSNEPIDVQTYDPIQASAQSITRLSQTPKLQALASSSLRFQRKRIGSCMSTRHFVIVRASMNEVALTRPDGNPPSILSILLTFSWMKKQSKRSSEDVFQELRIRSEVVRKGLNALGLNAVPLHNQALAQYYASTLVPGSLVLPFSHLEESNPLQFQQQAA